MFSCFTRLSAKLVCIIANPLWVTVRDIAAFRPRVLDIQHFAVPEVVGMHCASRCTCDVLGFCVTLCAAWRLDRMPIAIQCALYRAVPWAGS